MPGLFDDVDWGKAIVGIGGQYLTGRANAKAANTANQGTMARIRAEQEAAAQANARLESIAAAARPDMNTGSSHFRQIVATDPNQLTPQQLIGLEDAKRTLVNSPVLRTSGRATSRAVADVENRVRAPAVQQNIQRQDRAAGQLMQRGNQAVAAQTQQANVDLGTGRAVGAAQQEAATTGAQADLATNQSMVNVLGSIIAGDTKDKYKSRYMKDGGEV